MEQSCYGKSWQEGCKTLKWQNGQGALMSGCPQYQNCGVATASNRLVPPSALNRPAPTAGIPVPPQANSVGIPRPPQQVQAPTPPPPSMRPATHSTDGFPALPPHFVATPAYAPHAEQYVGNPQMQPGQLLPAASMGQSPWVNAMPLSALSQVPSPLAVQEPNNPAIPASVVMGRHMWRSGMVGVGQLLQVLGQAIGNWYSYHSSTPFTAAQQAQYMNQVYPGHNTPK